MTPATTTNGHARTESDHRIPVWVINQLDEQLARPVHFINARTIERGPFRGAYLVNTSGGAALVTKSRLGEPEIHFLGLPGHRVHLSCFVCGERIMLMEPDLPNEVFCGTCGAEYRIGLDGSVAKIHGSTPAPLTKEPAPEPTPEPAKAAPAAPAPTPTEPASGPYRHGDYTLYTRQVDLKNGGTRPIYFFAKSTPKSGHAIAMPPGFHVGVNERTGLPFLKKGEGETETLALPKRKTAPRPQCGALTGDGKQCRNSARHGSHYCASHKGYRPPSQAVVLASTDTKPTRGEDTLPSVQGTKSGPAKGTAQCLALTGSGGQCKNASRKTSKYCTRHKGYRPPTSSKVLAGTDTKPRSSQAADTLPRVRKARTA